MLKRIGIAGFGMEGRAAYEHFRGTAELHIFDDQKVDMSGIGAIFHHGLTIPADIDVVYKTPGIPLSNIKRESRRTRITTLTDDVLEEVGYRSVGVTGTKGKGTIVSLIHHVLQGVGRTSVVFGNIGIANMELLRLEPIDAQFVIELSSYQCELITHSPHIAILTNIYPEHLTHHGSFAAYRKAKLNIAKFQGPDDVFINGSDIETDFEGRLVRPGTTYSFETKLKGAHNQRNCALALLALTELGVAEDVARQHIATFEPLPHRIENVGEFNGITFYDDTLATLPEATLATLEALGQVDTLIIGGYDRHISFTKFADALAKSSIENFIVFPETGPKMVTKVSKKKNIIPVKTMEEAVRASYAHTKKGGVVVLSPASPSFNLFVDYRDKSAQFREWIQKLA